MLKSDLYNYLKEHYPKENESCEWKSFHNLKNAFSSWEGQDIISYVSAISNMNGGHLVIGIADQTHEINGIENFHNYTEESTPLLLTKKCVNLSSEGLKVESITTSDTNQTVWIIHIPRHTARKPVYSHDKPWQRIGDSLVLMTKEREQAILSEQIHENEDWSGKVIENASLDDLDTVAIEFAKEKFIQKYPNLHSEFSKWNTKTFLNKAKITINDKITTSAILLLGKPESEHFLQPAVAKISWILKDEKNNEKDYEHFSCPFLTFVESIFSKIRNLHYRYIKDGTLFPEETDQYEPYVIREALNNCIAHQDYIQAGKINVVEKEDGHLIFSNTGFFLPGSIEKVIKQDAPQEKYRNPFLVQAMVNLNMIDTIGSGIKRMFNFQKEKFFPLPDYDLSDNKVKVTITGKILDFQYARVLAQHPNLTLDEIILLDKVQKKISLSKDQARYLIGKQLIEGRRPNYFISAKVAQSTGQKAAYTRYKAFDQKYYQDIIIEAIKQHGSVTRKDINNLLTDKLSDSLNAKQKKIKVNNILSDMRKNSIIKNTGTDRSPKWILSN